MSNSRTQTILVFALLISAAGCSGSRLRNMVGRSEYVPIEELEADGTIESERKVADRRQQMLADSSDEQTDGELVSQQREVAEREAETEPPTRKGFFDFVKNMRKSDENKEEFAPDPFATVADPEKVQVAAVERKAAQFEQKQVEDAVAKYDETIATVEKEAESLAEKRPFAFETENTDNAAEALVNTTDEVDNAFAEFADELDKQPAAAAVAEVVNDIPVNAVASFDELLDQTDGSEAEQKTASAFSSELFPKMDGDLVDAFEFPVDNKVAESTEPPAADLALGGWGDDELDTAITDAAQKHGFASDPADPWAAFKNSGSTTQAPVSNKPQQDVVWNENAEASNTDFPNLSFSTGLDSRNVDDPAGKSPFHQVSATRSVEENQPIELSPSVPLMIPGASNESSSGAAELWPGTALENTDDHRQPTAVTKDPFLTSVPVFEESADDADVGSTVVESVASPAVTTAGQAGGWSRRTWFLLIGCVIVALLLFMPDRYNRTNA